MTSSERPSDKTLRYGPFSGQVSIHLLGKPHDWNISGDESELVLRRVGAVAQGLGVSKIFAPRPAKFNAEIVAADDLKEEIVLADEDRSVIMYRGIDADGVEFPKHDQNGYYAFWLSSADCITIVARHSETGHTIAAHGGRDCLVDRGRINGGTPRKFESVVHAIADRFSKTERKALKVFMTCGIGPEHFEHRCDDAKYGQANAKMIFDIQRKWGATSIHGDPFEGKISLSEVIRSQFVSLGVAPHNIGYDTVDTYTDTDPNGELRWWSNRRGDGKKRNGVLVVQNW